MKNYLKKTSIPNYLTVLSTGSLILLGIFSIYGALNSKSKIEALSEVQQKSCTIKMYRKSGAFKYAHPLIMSDNLNESSCMEDLKVTVNNVIEKNVNSNKLGMASVYIRNLNDGEWISMNDDEKFNPGSLFKLPVFISYLKWSELKPDLMSTKITYSENQSKVPSHSYQQTTLLQDGMSYDIKFLLEQMIIHSDNKATFLLNNYMNQDVLKQVFNDLEMQMPDLHDRSYAISTKDYSKFLRVLYNGDYLNAANSEYALSVLSKSTFNDGLKQGVPQDVEIARKFGEFGDKLGNKQLHESGIIYNGESPYLITIMTRGKDIKDLSMIISEISKNVFQYYNHS